MEPNTGEQQRKAAKEARQTRNQPLLKERSLNLLRLRIHAKQRQIIVELAHRATDCRNNRSWINRRAYLKPRLASSCRNEECWRDFAPQRPILRVANDTHDFMPCALAPDTADPSPERILILEKAPDKCLVDHSRIPLGVRWQSEILRGERAPSFQGNTHGLEKSW